jgi:hypothetical protein
MPLRVLQANRFKSGSCLFVRLCAMYGMVAADTTECLADNDSDQCACLDRRRRKAEADKHAIGGTRFYSSAAAEALPYQGPSTKVLDLHGRRVLPGFNDAHTLRMRPNGSLRPG